MKNKAEHRDISDIIEKHLKPHLKSECERLVIPQSFIAGIYGVYPEPFVRSSHCELIKQDEEIKKE